MEPQSKKSSGNPKDVAALTRVPLSLWPQTATIYGALGMTEGHFKYGGYNYRSEGVCVSTYVDAILRHLSKFYNGQWADSKSLVPHLGSILGCGAILVDGFEKGNIIDDRPPAVDVDNLLAMFEQTVIHLQKLYPNGPGRFTELGQR